MPLTMDKTLKQNETEILIAKTIVSPPKKTFLKTMDAIIVGGGPAGAYLAHCCAKKGIDVALIDNSHSREKPCGGALSPRALRKFPILQAIPGPKDFHNSLKLKSPLGNEISLKTSMLDKWVGVSRKSLDEFLLEAAVRRGACFHKALALQVRHENGGWQVRTNRGTFRGRILIGADGVRGIVRKSVSQKFTDENIAVSIGYTASGIDCNATMIRQFMSTPDGLMWINGRGGSVSMGIRDSIGNARGLKQKLDYMRHILYPSMSIESQWASLSPTVKVGSFYDVPCAGRDWALIGDAAGHLNSFTGEGIMYALWSAELAAQAIEDGDIRLFDRSWREEYGKELYHAVQIKKVLNAMNLENVVSLAKRSESICDQLSNLYVGNQLEKGIFEKMLRVSPKILWELSKSLFTVN